MALTMPESACEIPKSPPLSLSFASSSTTIFPAKPADVRRLNRFAGRPGFLRQDLTTHEYAFIYTCFLVPGLLRPALL
jgi:hypothetical protein